LVFRTDWWEVLVSAEDAPATWATVRWLPEQNTIREKIVKEADYIGNDLVCDLISWHRCIVETEVAVGDCAYRDPHLVTVLPNAHIPDGFVDSRKRG
jgi:hypothetical protein